MSRLSSNSNRDPIDALNIFSKSRDFSKLQLKKDHAQRPIWVTPDRRVYLETYSPIYKQAYDFLIAIADPVCRPENIHEYEITTSSLYAAASLGLRTDDIVSGLNRLSKTHLDDQLIKFINDYTLKCGKVRLVLRKTRYFVESIYPDVLRLLLANPTIADSRIDHLRGTEEAKKPQEEKKQEPPKTASGLSAAPAPSAKQFYNERVSIVVESDIADVHDEETGFLIANAPDKQGIILEGTKEGKAINQAAAMGLSEEDLADEGAPPKVLAFEVDATKVEEVRRVCIEEINYPMLEEYDFRRDNTTVDLPINLKPSTQIREYQEKSLSKMFGNGRARSGIIVLPCGAGKTLVGITAASTVKKSTLIFCTTGVAVDQWRRQVLHWTNLPSKYVAIFTSTTKDRILTDAVVVITTYNMVSFAGARSKPAEAAMKFITTHEWGLVLLDEVHVAPAKQFRKCVGITHSRCKLGLTATLVREDDLVKDLFFLLGPKLYEANWLDLQAAGHIATVQCVEIWCPMTAEFYRAYLNEKDIRKHLLLYCMNPNKFRACEYLIRLHEERGDKVLVFSDNVFALETYALMLGKPYIYGGTEDTERLELLSHFQHDPKVNTLFISKVGDNSIDLPDVNVIIQISSHFSSRRQEAQRLGRILRPKGKGSGRFNAFFYSLVSRDTREMVYATKREKFLVDQGYSFKVVPGIPELDDPTSPITSQLKFTDKKSQLDLLSKVMATDVAAGTEESLVDDPWSTNYSGQESASAPAKKGAAAASRKRGNMQALSGGDGLAYAEFEKRKAEKPKRGGFRGRGRGK